jgi:putative glutamine amidotransferase
MTFGITCSHFAMPEDEDNIWRLRRYQEAIAAGGGEAEMLWIPRELHENPELDEAALLELARAEARRCGGLLISGGADLPPEMYGEATREDGEVHLIRAERPRWEAALSQAFWEAGQPILGICYGCQFLNVWRGGSLIQDIPTQWPDCIEHSGVRHGVHLPPGSKLSAIIGADEFIVESSHHQAVKKLAPDARLIATAPDGVAEAIEFPEQNWVYGVQWHPERTPESLATQRLFAAFVEAARQPAST